MSSEATHSYLHHLLFGIVIFYHNLVDSVGRHRILCALYLSVIRY